MNKKSNTFRQILKKISLKEPYHIISGPRLASAYDQMNMY